MESKPLVTFALATHNRRKMIPDCIDSILKQTYDNIEIIVVDNGSTDGTYSLFNSGEYDLECIDYYKYDEPLGVAKARNICYEKSDGDYVITIDDDCILPNRQTVENVVSVFQSDKNVGVVSLPVYNYYNGMKTFSKKPREWLFYTPFYPQNNILKIGNSYYSSTFPGGGNAIRQELFDQIGYLPDDFHWGGEELDLSLRLHESDFKIQHLPEEKVLHKQKLEKRDRKNSVRKGHLENKIKVMVKYLPIRHVILGTLFWSIVTLYKTNLDFMVVLKAYVAILQNFKELLEGRAVLNDETIKQIKNMNGRLY